VDAWIDQAGSSTSSAQQQELYCKIATQINADVPVIPLFEHLVISAYRARLQNFAVSPGPSNFTTGSENWWLRP
jgi:ABC-type transport system substrate-binding protein